MSFLRLLLARDRKFTYSSTMSEFRSRKSHLHVRTKSSTLTSHVSLRLSEQDTKESTITPDVWPQKLVLATLCLFQNQSQSRHESLLCARLRFSRFWAPKGCRIKCNVWPRNLALCHSMSGPKHHYQPRVTPAPILPRLESH